MGIHTKDILFGIMKIFQDASVASEIPYQYTILYKPEIMYVLRMYNNHSITVCIFWDIYCTPYSLI